VEGEHVSVLSFVGQVGGHDALEHDVSAVKLLGFLLERLEDVFLALLLSVLSLDVEFVVDKLVVEVLDLLFDFLHDAHELLRLLVLGVEVLLHLDLVGVGLGLVGVVVPVFGLKEHVIEHQLVDIILKVTVVGMSSPGDEPAIFDQHGEGKAWHFEIFLHFLEVVLVADAEGQRLQCWIVAE